MSQTFGRPSSRRGMAIVEVAIATGLVVALGMMFSRLTRVDDQARVTARASSTQLSFRGRILAAQANPGAWLTRLRAEVPAIAACLRTSPAPNCPSPDSALANGDARLQALFLGRYAAPIDLVDLAARPLAGTEVKPLYLDAMGFACAGGANDPACVYRARGYLVRQNASGYPGAVSFVVKLEPYRARGLATESRWTTGPAYFSVYLGNWAGLADGASCNLVLDGQCLAGQYQYGVAPDGKALCRDLTLNCAADQYLAGITAGVASCQTLPAPPLPPPQMPLQVECESEVDNPKQIVYNLSQPVAELWILQQNSRVPCTKGSTYDLTPDKRGIWVSKGCRAAFGFTYE